MRKRLLIAILSAVMVFTTMPFAAFADTGAGTGAGANSAYDGPAIRALAAQLQDPANDPFRDTSGNSMKAAETYPAKYDLRDLGYVTPVKFQNPFGSCWGFAAIAAAESSILGSGLAAQDGYDANSLDLSEKHLVYFVSQPINDKTDPQYGEGTHVEAGVTLADQINGGGLPFMATSLFASGTGPVLEERDPLLKYMGKNGWTDKRTVNGKVVDYCYDDEDDWSLPDDMRFKQSYVLKESYMLDSPAQVNDETKEYTYNPTGTAQIKEMLMNKRAVQIGFCADTSTPTQEVREGQYISVNWAHYTYNAEEYPNHAVTIVGWDDDYDKSNFVEGHQPPENGAWLVKNSWGSEEESFPNKGPGWGLENSSCQHTGYFWLSYYDKTISMAEALDFDKSNVGSSYNLDEHDFMPVQDVNAALIDQEIVSANVFKADECQRLEQVSCETTFPNTKVVSKVYILPDKFSDPTDGKLVDTTEATFSLGGFHKMSLSTPDVIQKGQYYSIVQTQTVPGEKGDEYAFNFPFAMNKEMQQAFDPDTKTWVEGVINKGESFVYADGKWIDYSDDKLRDALLGMSELMYTFDNFPIKGYSTPVSNLSIRVNGDPVVSYAEGNNTSTFRVTYKGDAGGDISAPKITWELAEGGSDIFTLTPDPSDPSRATVTTKDKASGSTLMYVTADGVGTAVVKLSVKKRTIGAITILSDTIYNGKAQKPKIEVEDDNEEVIPASHYTVKYRKNKKCGDAEVLVTIKKGDTIYEEQTDKGFFTIKPKKAVIKSLTAGKGKLTVKVKDQKASGVKKYKLSYRVKGSSKWKSKNFKASKGTSLTVKGLKKGKRYQVKVCALGPDDFEGADSKTKVSGKIK